MAYLRYSLILLIISFSLLACNADDAAANVPTAEPLPQIPAADNQTAPQAGQTPAEQAPPGPGNGAPGRPGSGRRVMMMAISDLTGLSPQDIFAQGQDGATVAEILETNGVDIDAAKTALQTVLASSDLTASEIEETIAAFLDEPLSFGGGFGGNPSGGRGGDPAQANQNQAISGADRDPENNSSPLSSEEESLVEASEATASDSKNDESAQTTEQAEIVPAQDESSTTGETDTRLAVASSSDPNETSIAQRLSEDHKGLLARSAALGFLNSLLLTGFHSEVLLNTYITQNVLPQALTLAEQDLQGYALETENWLDPETYQVKVRLKPNNLLLNLNIAEEGQRWKVIALELDLAAMQNASGTNAANQATSSQAATNISFSDVSATLSEPKAEVLTGQLILQAQTGGTIYLFNQTAASLEALTQGLDPVLSPDGTQLAYTRWDGAEVGALWIYDLTQGSERMVLGDIQYQPKYPTWSPDGTQIIISYQHGGQREIESHCTESGQIPRGAFDISRGSETGRICYKIAPDTYWQLRRIDVNTGTYEDLPSATYAYTPVWDPIQPWRVFFRDAEFGLVYLDLNQSSIHPVLADTRLHGPEVSPDGRQLLFSYQQDNYWEVYTYHLETGALSRLTQVPFGTERYHNAAPSWSPDGSQIIFFSDRSGTWAYWLMQADGTNPRQVIPSELTDPLGLSYQGVDERLISWR